MTTTTSQARVTGEVVYRAHGGQRTFPLGPCLLERTDGQAAEIIWGTHGQHCAPLSLQEMARAEADGDLVVLE